MRTEESRRNGVSSPASARALAITIERLDDGEVSPYLTDALGVGDRVELRGPIGGYFVWDAAATTPVQLIAGGSGIVPLIAMARAHRASGSTAPFRLLYSVRSGPDAMYRAEVESLADPLTEVTFAYTRQ